MDPSSIVAGSVALVKTANKVATVLVDTYRDFTNAPTEMVEIADQVTICSGLVDVFAHSIKSAKLTRDFHSVAQNLVDQCQRILRDLSETVADQNRLRYAFGKKKSIIKKQKDLKRLQHMFIFLTTCYIYHPSQSGHLGQADINTLQGTLQNVPVQIAMPNSSGRGSTLLYEATLTLKASSVSGSSRMSTKPSDGDSKRGKDSLDNMRQSPYFSESFLQPPQSKADYARYQIEEPDEEGRFELLSREAASRDVEKLISRWFLSSSPGPSSPRPSGRHAAAPIPRAPIPRAPQPPRAPEPPLPPPPPGHYLDSEDEGEDFDHIHVPYPEDDGFPPARHTVSPLDDLPPAPRYPPIPNYPSVRDYPPAQARLLRPAGTRPAIGPRGGSVTSISAYPPASEAMRGGGGRGGLKGMSRRRSWDWACDGCDGKFVYDDGNRQFQCMRCKDPFDFCEDCLDDGDHQHGRREFAEVRGP